MIINAIKTHFINVINKIKLDDTNKKVLFYDDTSYQILKYITVAELQEYYISSIDHINTLINTIENDTIITIPYYTILFLCESNAVKLITDEKIVCYGKIHLITNLNINEEQNEKVTTVYKINIIDNVFDNYTFTSTNSYESLFNSSNSKKSAKNIEQLCDTLNIQNRIFIKKNPSYENNRKLVNIIPNTNALITVILSNYINMFSHSISHLYILYNYLPSFYESIKDNKYFCKYKYNSVNELNVILKEEIIHKFSSKYATIIDIDTNKNFPEVMPLNIIKMVDKYNKKKLLIKSYAEAIKKANDIVAKHKLDILIYLQRQIIAKTIDPNDIKYILLPHKNTFNEYDIYCLIILAILNHDKYNIITHKIAKHSGIEINHMIIQKCLNIKYNYLENSSTNNPQILENYFEYGQLFDKNPDLPDFKYIYSIKKNRDLSNCINTYVIYVQGNVSIVDLEYVNELRNKYKRSIVLGAFCVINTIEFVKNIFD